MTFSLKSIHVVECMHFMHNKIEMLLNIVIKINFMAISLFLIVKSEFYDNVTAFMLFIPLGKSFVCVRTPVLPVGFR